MIFEDDVSAVVRLRNLMINLLDVGEAPTLVEPRRVAAGDAGSCFLLTIEVEDANATCAELAQHDSTPRRNSTVPLQRGSSR